MEIRHLRYFVAVAEELNFRRAADRLNVSQPPLTKQIQALEALLDVRLFDRNKQRVTLTAAGREFLVAARGILTQLGAAKARIGDVASGTRGELRIAYTESAIHVEFMLRALHTVRTEHPQIKLTLNPMQSMLQLAALEARELDVGFIWAVPERAPSMLRFEPIWSEPLVAAIPRHHPAATMTCELPLGDLRPEPFITVSRDGGTLMFRMTIRACFAAGFAPNIVREAPNLASALGSVAAGAGVAIVPMSVACLQAPGVRYRTLTGCGEQVQLYWVSHRDDASPLVPVFRTVLRAERR